jgi:hypothetical protein
MMISVIYYMWPIVDVCACFIWYINDCYCEMDVQSELHCMISCFIIVLLCNMSDTLYVAFIATCVCSILSDNHLDLYCMIKYFIIIVN